GYMSHGILVCCGQVAPPLAVVTTVPNSPVTTPRLASRNCTVVRMASSPKSMPSQVAPLSALDRMLVRLPTTQSRLPESQARASTLLVVLMSRGSHFWADASPIQTL